METKALTVYCPKDEEEVPIQHCIGSVSKHRERCQYLVYAEVDNGQRAKVNCNFKPNSNRK